MRPGGSESQLSQAQATVRELQEELAATNHGLVALTIALEQNLDARTAELSAAHEELNRTNSELMQLTLDMEDRVARRTAELEAANAALRGEITERTRAEEALCESEARYRNLFEQSPLGIYRTTPEGKILAANAALLRALGYASLDELAARDLDVDGCEGRYPRQEFKRRIERDGQVIGFESAWLKKDGQVLAVRESARAVSGQDGRTLYYEGTIEDVTAQRRGEEERRRLVAAVEQASETIVITDTEGRIEYVNPAFERTCGYTPEEATGQKLSMLDDGEHDDAYYAMLWQTITQSETWQGHFVNRRKNGSFYEEDATISPIRDGSGTIVNFIALKRDVTQEVALQTQLRQAQKMEAIGMLAGGVAHDFNNLLQAMLNHVELVRDRHADAAQMAVTMAELEAEIRRGSSLTRQL
ncbi:MAG TPA: PAS domain S-box protein, partial [Thermoanaerobaculaceae bacterium]|nr:PAS domain S-box protein [Thermoanaerobaculaceae bacterium]